MNKKNPQIEKEQARIQYYWKMVREKGVRYPEFHWPSVELLLGLVFTYDILNTHIAKRLQKYGLSPSTFNVLAILNQTGEKGCKQFDLSKLLLVSRAGVTGLIDGLVKRDLVERVYDENDRRVCITKLTKEGKSLIEEILPEHYKRIKQIASSISPQEKKVMNKVFLKMREKILSGLF